MGLLAIFSGKKEFQKPINTFFGQYAELHKSRERYEYLKKANNLFKKQSFLNAYEYFFLYLSNPETQNVAYKKEAAKISFKIIQGSTIISGFISEQEILAEAEIVRFNDSDSSLMQELLQKNYSFKYCKFAIKNNVYILKFYGITSDLPPESLYRAMQEMATYADFYDDILLQNFSNLKAVNTAHIHKIESRKTDVRLKYLKKYLFELADVDTSDYEAIAFNSARRKILNLLYSINYLIVPNGKLLRDVNELIKRAENRTELYIVKTNKLIIEKAKEILLYEKDFALMIQDSIKTFPNKEISNIKDIREYFSKEIKNRIFSPEQYHIKQSYIIFSIPHKFGLSEAREKLLMPLWQYYHPDFFKDIDCNFLFFENDEINETLIKKYVSSVIKEAKIKGESILFDIDKVFAKKEIFARVFLQEFVEFKDEHEQ